MKTLGLFVFSLSLLLLPACGDFQWLPDQATFALTLTPSKFTNLCAVLPNQSIASNALTVSGIASPVAISVSGGEYSIDGGTTWTSTAGTISTGQTVKVRPTGGKITTDNTSVTVTLTINTTQVTFTATTGGCQQTTTQDFVAAPAS
jgi:hypothetical protein